MPKYYGVCRTHDGAGPISFSYEADDVPKAIDKFLAFCGISRSHPDDEYEIFLVDGVKYYPVSQKFKSKRTPLTRELELAPLDEEAIQAQVFTEKVYVSWRDAA